jgi:heme/copper-type cytochrome/quinol oxidase subunit 1
VLSTNHRRIAVLYFMFVGVAGVAGLALATLIRAELAYPGRFVFVQNAERYLTLISVHGIIMVFFVVIPLIFGAFGNFLLPTQLGIRDVAFPRLNSFMFWVTPSGFVLLLHIVFFDRCYNVTYWANYSELKAQLRRRYSLPTSELIRFHARVEPTTLALRLASPSQETLAVRSLAYREMAPLFEAGGPVR